MFLREFRLERTSERASFFFFFFFFLVVFISFQNSLFSFLSSPCTQR